MKTHSEIEISLIENLKAKLIMEVRSGKEKVRSHRSTAPRVVLSINADKLEKLDLEINLYMGVGDLFIKYEINNISIKLNNIGSKVIYWGKTLSNQTEKMYLKIKRETREYVDSTDNKHKWDKLAFSSINQKSNSKSFVSFDLIKKFKKKGYEVEKISKKAKDTMAVLFMHLMRKTGKGYVKKEPPQTNDREIDYIHFNDSRKILKYGKLEFGDKKLNFSQKTHQLSHPNEQFNYNSAKYSLPTGETLTSGGCSSDKMLTNKAIYLFNHSQKKGYLIGVLPFYLKNHSTKYLAGSLYIYNGNKNNEGEKQRNIYKFDLNTGMSKPLPIPPITKGFLLTGNANKLFIIESLGTQVAVYDQKENATVWRTSTISNLLKDRTERIHIIKQDKEFSYILKANIKGTDGMPNYEVYKLNFATEELELLKKITANVQGMVKRFQVNGHLYFFNNEPSRSKIYSFKTSILMDKEKKSVPKRFDSVGHQISIKEFDYFRDSCGYVFCQNEYDFRDYDGDSFYSINKDSIDYCFGSIEKKVKGSGIVGLANDVQTCSIPDGSMFVLCFDKEKLFNDTYICTSQELIPIESPKEKYSFCTLSYNRGMIYLVGNTVSDEYPSCTMIEVYDLLKSEWTKIIKFKGKIDQHISVVQNKKLYLLYANQQKQQKLLTFDFVDRIEREVDIKFKTFKDVDEVFMRVVKDAILLIPKLKEGKGHVLNEILNLNVENEKVETFTKLPKNTKIYDIVYRSGAYVVLWSKQSKKEVYKSNYSTLPVFCSSLAKGLDNVKGAQRIVFTEKNKKQNSFSKLYLSNADELNLDRLLKYRYSKYEGVEDQHKEMLILSDSSAYKYNFTLNNVQRLRSEYKIPKGCTMTQINDGRMVVVGGETDNGFNSGIHIYNPYLQKWKMNVAKLRTNRKNHNAVLYKEKVIILGGYDEKGELCEHNEYYCLRQSDIFDFPPFHIKRSEFANIHISNKLIVLQGQTGKGITNTIEWYNEQTGSWQCIDKPYLSVKLKGHTALKSDFRTISLFGGMKDEETPNMRVFALQLNCIFQDTSSTVIKTTKNILMTQATNGSIVTDQRDVYYIEGNFLGISQKHPLNHSSADLNSTSLSATFINRLSFLKKSDTIRAAVMNIRSTIDTYKIQTNENFKHLYLFGTNTVSTVFRMNLDTLKISTMDYNKEFELNSFSAALTLPDGRIFIGGGQRQYAKTFSSKAYILTPVNNRFQVEVIANMIRERFTFGVAYLSGYIYVIGGRHAGAVS